MTGHLCCVTQQTRKSVLTAHAQKALKLKICQILTANFALATQATCTSICFAMCENHARLGGYRLQVERVTRPKFGPLCIVQNGSAGQKELVLASLNGKVQEGRVHFSRHNFPNSRALVDWSANSTLRRYISIFSQGHIAIITCCSSALTIN